MNKKLVLFVLFVLPAMAFAKDGVFPGLAKGGKRGDVGVNVTVKNSKITDIVITQSKEDRLEAAFPRLKAAMIKENNYNVDVVSGASMSSRAFVAAVGEALKAAGLAEQLKGKLIKPADK